MSIQRKLPTYRGRNIGILVFTVAQLFIGAIHIFFGFLLLFFENSLLQPTIAYDIYTIVFGLLVLVFAIMVWQGRKIGWVGTIAVSLFVIAADSLTLLNLPSIPGIPKLPAVTEIVYSLVIIYYLCQKGIRTSYLQKS